MGVSSSRGQQIRERKWRWTICRKVRGLVIDERRVPHWRVLWFYLPAKVKVWCGNGSFSLKRDDAAFEIETGRIIRWEGRWWLRGAVRVNLDNAKLY